MNLIITKEYFEFDNGSGSCSGTGNPDKSNFTPEELELLEIMMNQANSQALKNVLQQMSKKNESSNNNGSDDKIGGEPNTVDGSIIYKDRESVFATVRRKMRW